MADVVFSEDHIDGSVKLSAVMSTEYRMCRALVYTLSLDSSLYERCLQLSQRSSTRGKQVVAIPDTKLYIKIYARSMRGAGLPKTHMQRTLRLAVCSLALVLS